MNDLPDKDVNIKISTCQECNGIVRVAVEHMMDNKSIRNFAEEAMTYNLSISTMKLLKYKSSKYKWCSCSINQ